MIDTLGFINFLKDHGVDFYCGVPDSLLSPVSAALETMSAQKALSHYVCANEGNAIGLACGHYLGSQTIPCVYMQNSGLGNAVNPLVSLAAPEVYGIPLLMIIGWRGEGKDEPQHVMQGRINEGLLNVLEIPYKILDQDCQDWSVMIADLLSIAKEHEKPVALLVRSNTFSSYKCAQTSEHKPYMSRERAIELVISSVSGEETLVATTGKTSRELYELRKSRNESGASDFLTVGSMGHASQIAAGIAINHSRKNVLCLDGDGACLMHMGGLLVTAPLSNFKHILLNNGVHDSVGGQQTVAGSFDLGPIAKACGYKNVQQVASEEELLKAMENYKNVEGSVFLEIMIKPGSRTDLGRPKESPQINKKRFMMQLSNSQSEG
ncbi:phosphonopyruvate decarboxylase [Terasakiella pusilla]|uniref:phosphonopyruvate decarboxylase n=1 Tax=Terasakiella pusilla TaxID=64973 RepID=UPI00048FBA4E|nr:phosphonopyruvate decarboxylase [Terasakiella pusilla]